LESTKGIEIKLGTYIDVNERTCRRQELSYILLEFSFFKSVHKKVVFFVMSWCTSSVWLQVLPSIYNMHLGSIPPFERITCFFSYQEM